MEKFTQLLNVIEPERPISGQAFDIVIERWLQLQYFESHRKYHTFEHIAKGLELLEGCREHCYNSDIVELAWLFHDAIYIPGSKCNEEQSANTAKFYCLKLGLSRENAEKVFELIMATRHRKRDVNIDLDESIMCDMDLSILGRSEKTYKSYSENIRNEYFFLSLEEFNKGRLKFLKKMLNRSNIYYNSYFIEKFEEKAIDNMTKEAQELQSTIASKTSQKCRKTKIMAKK